jgi:hypothetical protein
LALLPATLASGLLVLRTSWEDRLPQTELPGYTDCVSESPYQMKFCSLFVLSIFLGDDNIAALSKGRGASS